ncbi:MAG: hypothetical protein WC859_08675, partial [Elusimicrobiota bacterium]
MKSFIAVAVLLLGAVPSYSSDVFLSLNRSNLPVSDAPTNIDVIESKDFEQSSARTVGDLIGMEPGVLIKKSASEG